MVRLKPLRCIKRAIFPTNMQICYEYAPYGVNQPLYMIRQYEKHGVYSLMVAGLISSGTFTGLSSGYSHNFDYVLKQMHKHYRTVYRKKIEDIVA